MGKGSSAVLMLYNNIRPEDVPAGSTVHARNNTFGILFGGGKFPVLDNTIENYNGYYTGMQLNLIKRVGIDFPNNSSPNAIGIQFASARNDRSFKTAISLGNNKINLGGYSGSSVDPHDLWRAGNQVMIRSGDGITNRRIMVGDGYSSIPVGFAPTHTINFEWSSGQVFRIPAQLITN